MTPFAFVLVVVTFTLVIPSLVMWLFDEFVVPSGRRRRRRAKARRRRSMATKLQQSSLQRSIRYNYNVDREFVNQVPWPTAIVVVIGSCFIGYLAGGFLLMALEAMLP